MIVGITGASGFVGSVLAEAFSAAGHGVVPLGRGAPGLEAARATRFYDLGHPVSSDTLAGLDVLVHCAYDMTDDTARSRERNVRGSLALVDAARVAGVRKLVYISTLSPAADAPSQYGRNKAAVEAELDDGRDLIVRPGLVVGRGGLYGAMLEGVLRFRAAPVFDGGVQPVYLVGRTELAEAVVSLVAGGASGTYVLAAERPMTLADLYRAVASAFGLHIRLVRLPFAPTLAIVSTLEVLRVRLPLRAETLRGVAALRRVDVPIYSQLPARLTAAVELVAAEGRGAR